MKQYISQRDENILLYSTYTILYLNDTACNAIKELEHYLKDRDKESQKIYGALKKRVDSYFKMLYKAIGDKVDSLADYCAEMDEICYTPMLDFKNALYDTYKNSGLEDNEYYTQVETMRCMVELTAISSQKIFASALAKTQQAKGLNMYLLHDMKRIANNFANWVYRKVPKGLVVNLNEQSNVMSCFHKLSEALIKYDSHEQSYIKAFNTTK